MRQNTMQNNEGLAAPSPFLLYSLIVLFLLVIVGVMGAIAYFSTGRFIVLVPYGVAAVAVVIIGSIIGTLLFRRRLPRILPVLLIVGWIIIGVLGVGAAVYTYQNVLPPRYQAELITQIPVLRAFLPATPVGGVIPTVAAGADDGGMSADDLLGLTSPGATPTTAAQNTDEPEASVEATLEASQSEEVVIVAAAPTVTATITPSQIAPSPTSLPPTVTVATSAPTQPTSAQVNPLMQSESAISVASVPASIARPSDARIFGFTHVQQSWNNCGPANITMALSRYGWRESQDYAASFLKPSTEDKNVSPSEIVAFVNEQTGVRAVTRIGGDMELIKQMIAQEFPVMIETAYFPEGNDFLGHYHTVVGYDDAVGAFYVYDSYIGTGQGGAGLVVPYADFDANWQAFNRVFIVLYEQSRESVVTQILGELALPEAAAAHALTVAQDEARRDPRNYYAWFNLGTAFNRLGDHDSAARAYDRARSLGLPFRMLWYQHGPFEAYFNVGRYDDVEALVNNNLTNGAQYVEETYYWQGRVAQARGDTNGAAQSYRLALSHNSRYAAAQTALNGLN